MGKGLLRAAVAAGLLLGPSAAVCGDPPPPEAVGSGWRVRGGVAESAVAGLRVKPPEGWDLVLGDAVEAEDANADLGLLLRGTDLLVTVDAQESLGMSEQERLEEMLPVASLEKVRAAGKAVPVSAEECSFAMEPWTGKDGGIAYWIGGFTADGRAFCVTASCAAASREDSGKRLPEAAAALQVLRGKARDALAAELLALPDGQAAWQGPACYRRGVLRDFGHGILWRLPRAFWSVYLHDPKDAADEAEKGLVATVTDRVLGVEGTLEFHPAEGKDLAAYQKHMEGWFVDQSEGAGKAPAAGAPAAEDEEAGTGVEAALPVEFAGGRGLSTRIHDAEGWQWLVVSTLREGVGTTVWFGGEEAAMDAAAGTIREALAGVRLDPSMRAESLEKGVYRNDLYGFSMTLPRADLGSPTGAGGLDPSPMVFRLWWDGDVTIAVLAGPLSGGPFTAERVLKAFPHPPPEAIENAGEAGRLTPAVLGGEPCDRLSGKEKGRVALFMASRGGAHYSLGILGNGNLTEDRVEAIRSGFRFEE